MKEGPTYLMVTLAYHLPYTELSVFDEPWLLCSCKRKMRGVVGIPYVEMLIIIMVKIIVSIAGHDT
jgi:hypothetical protein